MITPKSHLNTVFRTPLEQTDRMQYLRLDKNEDVSGLSKTRIDRILKKVTPEFLASYPHVYKIQKKICQSLGIDEGRVLVTAGSDAAIKSVFEVFIEPGDEIVLPSPTYAMYDVYAQLFRAKVHHINYTDHLTLPVDQILSLIGPGSRLVVLANPNSPTGTVVSRDQIFEICTRAQEEDAIVLIDEAYFPYHGETVIDLTKTFENLIVTRTFSKAFGLASLRLGFAVAQPDLIRSLNVFKPMYETNGFAILFGCELLDHPQWVEENVKKTLEGRDYLVKQMKGIGLYTYPSYANFVNIRVGHDHVGSLVKYMHNNGILIKPGTDHPALRDCIRISTGPVSKMKKAEKHIKFYFKSISRL